LLIILIINAFHSNGQVNYQLVDDFDRSNTNTLGVASSSNSTWQENEAPGRPAQLQIYSNTLYCITDSVTELEPTNASINLTSELGNFDLGTGLYGWTIHFDLNRDPSGWGIQNYGLGFILAANEDDFSSSTVDGWAVLWTYSGNQLVFGRFENGIGGNDPLTSVIATGLDWNACSPLGVNVRIEVNENGGWVMHWEQGGAISNPTDIDASISISTVDDDTYFNDPLMVYSGPIWAHSTSMSPTSNSNGSFDNFHFGEEPTSSVANPTGLSASAMSSSQIDLSWSLNASNDDVLIAWNTENTFGTPTGSFSIGQGIAGGGTVLYTGTNTSSNHSSLSSNTVYFYKAWSVDGTTTYSPGVITSDTTFESEPASHPSVAAAVINGATWITVAWTDDGSDNYLVKGSETSPQDITAPTDLVPESNSLLVQNVPDGAGYHQFTGLNPETEYFFKIYPYNGTGTAVNYKTTGAVPLDSATTGELDLDLLITEVADPSDKSYAKFVEVMNRGTVAIDFASTPVYLCRQANGSPSGWAQVQLSGILDAGATQVFAYTDTSFSANYSLAATQVSSNISGNGNDGYFLYLNGNQSSGILLDAYGTLNENGEGKAWDYTDGHAVRRRDITSPNSTWTASEWIIIKDCNAGNMTPFAHAEDVIWQGTSSTNWNERGANWSGTHGFVPDGSYNVTVPVTENSPVVNEASACNSLNMANGAALGIGTSGVLEVVGTIP
jgi:hypothetical protein